MELATPPPRLHNSIYIFNTEVTIFQNYGLYECKRIVKDARERGTIDVNFSQRECRPRCHFQIGAEGE